MARFRLLLLAFGVGAVLAALGIFVYTQWLAGPAAGPPPADSKALARTGVPGDAPGALPAVMVFKSPTCGCCSSWVEHLRRSGFAVEVTDVEDMSTVKQRYGVPGAMASCHTALVDGYVVEGHVPASDVKRLLAERPDVTGLAVPGMPVGSPGMEQGNRHDPYEVIAFDRQGQAGVFARY